MPLITKDTLNGWILSHCPISPEMESAADKCFEAYKKLNDATENFYKTIPEGFFVKSFYGKGNCVIIHDKKELEKEREYWEKNS